MMITNSNAVVVPEISYPPFLTAEDFSLGTGGKISPEDPRVSPLLAAASAAIRLWCGWHIWPVVDESMILDDPGTGLLSLPTLRMHSLQSLNVNGYAVLNPSWSHLGDIRLPDSHPGRCIHHSSFRAINIRLRHGFASVPDIQQIVQQSVALALSSPLGATREQAGQVSISWATTAPGVSGGLALLERDFQVLSAYKLFRGA